MNLCPIIRKYFALAPWIYEHCSTIRIHLTINSLMNLCPIIRKHLTLAPWTYAPPLYPAPRLYHPPSSWQACQGPSMTAWVWEEAMGRGHLLTSQVTSEGSHPSMPLLLAKQHFFQPWWQQATRQTKSLGLSQTLNLPKSSVEPFICIDFQVDLQHKDQCIGPGAMHWKP